MKSYFDGEFSLGPLSLFLDLFILYGEKKNMECDRVWCIPQPHHVSQLCLCRVQSWSADISPTSERLMNVKQPPIH